MLDWQMLAVRAYWIGRHWQTMLEEEGSMSCGTRCRESGAQPAPHLPTTAFPRPARGQRPQAPAHQWSRMAAVEADRTHGSPWRGQLPELHARIQGPRKEGGPGTPQSGQPRKEHSRPGPGSFGAGGWRRGIRPCAPKHRCVAAEGSGVSSRSPHYYASPPLGELRIRQPPEVPTTARIS